MINQKITSFTDLNTWKEAHQLVLSIYLLTDGFPNKERFSLTDQMRRASISISSNIAEGFSRKTSKDRQKFYFIALGSLTELQNQLVIAKDLKYCTKESFQTLATQSIIVCKLINGLIKTA